MRHPNNIAAEKRRMDGQHRVRGGGKIDQILVATPIRKNAGGPRNWLLVYVYVVQRGLQTFQQIGLQTFQQHHLLSFIRTLGCSFAR